MLKSILDLVSIPSCFHIRSASFYSGCARALAAVTVCFALACCDDRPGNNSHTNDYELSVADKLTGICNVLESLDEQSSIIFSRDVDKDGNLQSSLEVDETNGEERGKEILVAVNPTRTFGAWQVNEKTKTVLITLHGQSQTYTFLNPSDICLLVAGSNLRTTDLQQSWFGDEHFSSTQDERE